MKISVITVCLNAETTIGECIDSVARQTHPDIEHWIVDGASVDGTVAVAEAHRHKNMRMVSEKDEGLYFAMNKGLALAGGEAIGFLHADDTYAHENVLASVASALGRETVQGCYADLVFVRPERPNRPIRYWKSCPYRPGTIRRGWMLPHPTLFLRSEVYRRFGGFDTAMTIGADWDLVARLFEVEQLATQYIPDTWVLMKTGGASTRNLRGIFRNNVETWRRYREYFGFGPSLLFPIRKWWHRSKQFLPAGKPAGNPGTKRPEGWGEGLTGTRGGDSPDSGDSSEP